MVDDPAVEVLTTKVRVSSGSLHLEDTLLDRQKRHDEGSSTEIENKEAALAIDLLVETVGGGGGGGLVDDTEDIETGDETGIIGSLTLGVVEVGGDSDNGLLEGVEVVEVVVVRGQVELAREVQLHTQVQLLTLGSRLQCVSSIHSRCCSLTLISYSTWTYGFHPCPRP